MNKLSLLMSTMLLAVVLAACGDNDNGSEKETIVDDERTQKESNKTDEEDTVKKENESPTEVDIYSDEVKGFIDDFNNFASLEEDIDLITEIEPAKETESGYSQTLFSSSEYVITTVYDKEGSIESIAVVIPENQPYRDLKGNGVYATLHVGAALGLDVEELTKEFEKALPNHAGLYFTDDYTVAFSTNDDVAELGIITMFINLSFSND